MHPRLQEVLDYTNRARSDLLAALDRIHPSKIDQRSENDEWSIREVVEHLHLVEKSSLRALFRTLRDAKKTGVAAAESETSSVRPIIDDVESRMVEKKRSAPEYTLPTGGASIDELKGQLKESRDGLHLWANEADGTALDTITFPHPALGDLSLYGWVAMLGAHERQHMEQIERIVKSLGG